MTSPSSWPAENALPSLEQLRAIEANPPEVQQLLFDTEPQDDRQARLERAIKACRGMVTTADQMTMRAR